MWTSSRVAAVAALALVVLGAGSARAGYFPPPPFITQYYNYTNYSPGFYNGNPLAFNPSYYAPTLYFRPSTAGPIFGLPAAYPTPSFNSSALFSTGSFGTYAPYSMPWFGTYGLYSTQTYGPPYNFPALADVYYYPYGTTVTTTAFEPYNYTGPYLGPMLYRP